MVFFNVHCRETINAYLMADLTKKQLDKIHASFELGDGSKYKPTLQLFVKQVDEYRHMTHAEIRRAETAAGRTGPFLIIDQHAIADEAVWYIDNFADDWCVAEGFVVSTNVLFQILTKTVTVPIQYACWSIGHGSDIQDHLVDYCGVPYPIPEDFVQEEAFGLSMDWDAQARCLPQSVTLEPGEYELLTDPAEIDKLVLRGPDAPRLKRMGRPTEAVSAATGLSRQWGCNVNAARDQQLEDGRMISFPEGSLIIDCYWEHADLRPPYERLPGQFGGFDDTNHS